MNGSRGSTGVTGPQDHGLGHFLYPQPCHLDPEQTLSICARDLTRHTEKLSFPGLEACVLGFKKKKTAKKKVPEDTELRTKIN